MDYFIYSISTSVSVIPVKMPTEGEECINAFQQYHHRPMEIPTKVPLKTFIYNPKTKAVFGRTSSSWCKEAF